MDKKITKTYAKVINDSNGIMVASLTAQSLNGTISNISISINTIDGYQANKDKVISSFNDFLASVKSDNQQSITLNNVESTADDETASAEALSSESESVVTSESESESQSESGSTLESQSDVSQSELDSQSESESETDRTSG